MEVSLGRPQATGSVWYVGEMADEQTAGVGRIALELDAVSTRARGTQNGGVVNAEVDLVTDYLIETGRRGLRGGNIGDEAVGWIMSLHWSSAEGRSAG